MNKKSENPWTTLSSKPIYSNPWISLREDQVINPNGGDGIYGVVEFANVAVGIIPIDEEDHTWLVGQYRYSLGCYSWEIPMGGSPTTVAPIEGAKRELQEETGMSAEIYTEIASVDISNCVTDEKGVVFLAEGLSHGETQFDETEQLDIKRVPVEAAIAMAMDGRIRDCLSVTGLLKLALLRQSR